MTGHEYLEALERLAEQHPGATVEDSLGNRVGCTAARLARDMRAMVEDPDGPWEPGEQMWTLGPNGSVLHGAPTMRYEQGPESEDIPGQRLGGYWVLVAG